MYFKSSNFANLAQKLEGDVARIVIGIPAFNEAKYIKKCLMSAISQSYYSDDIEVLVSDNASTDETHDICEQTVEEFDRKGIVKLHKQSVNIGAPGNFQFLLDQSDSEYFMWLGAHDALSPSFCKDSHLAMSEDKRISMACGNHVAMNESGDAYKKDIAYELSYDNNPCSRYLESARLLNNCYIIHSLFRRDQMIDLKSLAGCPSGDIIWISDMLWKGFLHVSKKAQCFRRYFEKEVVTKKVTSGSYVSRHNNSRFIGEYIKHFEENVRGTVYEKWQPHLSYRLFNILSNRYGFPFEGTNEVISGGDS